MYHFYTANVVVVLLFFFFFFCLFFFFLSFFLFMCVYVWGALNMCLGRDVRCPA